MLAGGPIGWIIGLVGTALVYFLGRGAVKDVIESQIRTQSLPPFLKRPARSKVATELSLNAGRFESDLHSLIREHCEPLYRAIDDINV